MIQEKRRKYLITALINEQPQYAGIKIPHSKHEQEKLLRSLFNIRPPLPADNEFLTVQDDYLQEMARQKGITTLEDLQPVLPGIYLWKGDITTLKCDAVVNAANSRMLGCFIPCHSCIDNAIHSAAGVQLRLECAEIMKRQGREETTGNAKITKAYNLPCRYVIHTVGPIIHGAISSQDCDLLASCYWSCMETADRNSLKNIAFCCISTGEFHFPNDRAAEIAIQTVAKYKKQVQSNLEVIFNVFKETDYDIYRKILLSDRQAAR